MNQIQNTDQIYNLALAQIASEPLFSIQELEDDAIIQPRTTVVPNHRDVIMNVKFFSKDRREGNNIFLRWMHDLKHDKTFMAMWEGVTTNKVELMQSVIETFIDEFDSRFLWKNKDGYKEVSIKDVVPYAKENFRRLKI